MAVRRGVAVGHAAQACTSSLIIWGGANCCSRSLSSVVIGRDTSPKAPAGAAASGKSELPVSPILRVSSWNVDGWYTQYALQLFIYPICPDSPKMKKLPQTQRRAMCAQAERFARGGGTRVRQR